jgi:hypothetical protein
MILPKLTDIAPLSEEVRSGQVYGVVQLYKVLEDRPALEKNPSDIFARTYLTDALRTALDQIRSKLMGQDRRGSLVFTGGYGSGKSHQLLALYHVLRHPDLAGEWLARQGYTVPLPRHDDLQVVVLHTARADYNNLWEPIFEHLGADEVLGQIKRYPAIPQIRQALGGRPTVVIIDEIENWYETILPTQADAGRTSQAANRTFLQHLLELANEPDVPLVVLFSLVRNTPDIVDVIDRTAPLSINMSTAADREDVLLYRLFGPMDRDKAARVVDAFIAVYRERQIRVPMGDYEAYRARMARVYPLHPELLRVLFERYSTASNYANTRGLLYLLASVLRNGGADAPLLLSSAVDAARFDDQLVALDRPLVEATVRDIERVSHIGLGREILSTVLLYSINREQEVGADETAVVLGIATPEVNPNDVLLGLNRLLGQAWHLHKLNGHYAVRVEENVFAVVQNRATDVGENVAIERVARVLAKEVLGGNSYVYEIDEMPDDRQLKVIVSLRALETDQDVYAIYAGRRYANRMVVLAPITGDLRKDQSLIDKARRIIAGEQIKKDVSDDRAAKVQDIIDEELKELKGRLAARFGFWPKVSVMVSDGPDGRRVEQEAVRKIQVDANAAKLLERAVSDSARIKEKILDLLRERGAKGLRTDLLYDDFYTIRRYPMVADTNQVTTALRELCKVEQVYIEGHQGRNFFGEAPFGLDEQAKAMLYHTDFAQVQRAPTPETEAAKIVYPEPKSSEVTTRQPTQGQGVAGVESKPYVVAQQLTFTEAGKHPRPVAGKFETLLQEADKILRVQAVIENDFGASGKTDKLEQAVKALGVSAEGLKLSLTLEWRGQTDRATLLQRLLQLPSTPGGSLSVTVEVERVIK